MGKKVTVKKRPSRPKGWQAGPRQVQAWLDEVERHVAAQDYESAVRTARQVLRNVPAGSRPYGEAQRYLGIALAMQQDFAGSYEAFSRALEVEPNAADLWYNRSLSARFLTRTCRSLLDAEQAAKLARNPQQRERFERERDFIRQLVTKEVADRGPHYTFEQLLEQQEAFQRGLAEMAEGQWAAAEATFRRVIAMSEYSPPQPWGNLAGCLIMQERYDEAEAALRRALEIDPNYELARENLRLLPTIRQQGPPATPRIRAPFEGQEVKRGVVWEQE